MKSKTTDRILGVSLHEDIDNCAPSVFIRDNFLFTENYAFNF